MEVTDERNLILLRLNSLADAAFWLYLRGAGDFAGGKQLVV